MKTQGRPDANIALTWKGARSEPKAVTVPEAGALPKAPLPAVRSTVGWCLFLILAFAAFAAFAPQSFAAAPKPLRQEQVEGLVRGGVASQRVAKLVEQHGIDFEVTPGFLQVLREDGAQKVLLDELQKEGVKKASSTALSAETSYRAQEHRIKGKDFLDHQLWNQAEAELRKSVKLNPADATAHFYLGLALGEEGKLNGAITQYREAILLSPDTAPAHFNLGNALLKERDWDGAIEQYGDVISLTPQDAKAHYALGTALYSKGDSKGAASEYQEALRLDPLNEKAHVALGLVLASENDVEGAIREYQKALKTKPGDAVVHADLASALLAKGDNQEALQELRIAVSLAPHDARYQASYEKLVNQLDPAGAR
jgi:tetratricopeptide (TPR) repeat protein